MSDSNPYVAPIDALVDPDREAVWPVPAEQTLENGSYLRIGERDVFTGAWILKGMFKGFALLVVLLAFIVAVNASESLLVSIVSLPLFLPWIFFKFEGFPEIAVGNPKQLARKVGGVTGEITFDPRLPGTPMEYRDTGDDPGILWLDGDWLCFDGDRVRMRLHRQEVASVHRRGGFINLFAFRGPSLVFDLVRPMTGRARFSFNIRARVSTPWWRYRGKRFKREVERWSASET